MLQLSSDYSAEADPKASLNAQLVLAHVCMIYALVTAQPQCNDSFRHSDISIKAVNQHGRCVLIYICVTLTYVRLQISHMTQEKGLYNGHKITEIPQAYSVMCTPPTHPPTHPLLFVHKCHLFNSWTTEAAVRASSPVVGSSRNKT